VHIPVLLEEVLKYLDPKPGENFIDCTVGEGGHAVAILERTVPDGKVLGIDADGESLRNIESRIKNHESRKQINLIQGNFANIEEIVAQEHFRPVSGVLMDLGLSSWQLEESGRGFSFLKNEPLDMRFTTNDSRPTTNDKRLTTNYERQITAEEIVHTWKREELEKILREYGEERYAGRIAGAIVLARKRKKLKTTQELVRVIREVVPFRYAMGRLHFATRTFQALRIAVNDELGTLKRGLEGACKALDVGGRLAVISFHSLEDLIVKNFFREHKKLGVLEVRTKKPVTPSTNEIAKNPRSRSAKLRAVVKISTRPVA